MFVLLDAIDVATASWVERRIFEIDNLGAFCDELGFEAIEPNRVYELDPSQINVLEQAHHIVMSDRSLPVEMVILRKRFKYDEFASHTGRELLLMLAGKKPFAHFFDGHFSEDLFEPHVREGRIIRFDDTADIERPGSSRRIFYALPGEEWRVEAFKTLWRLAEKYDSWDEGLEKMEGYLLGYETEIDPFHR